MTLSNYEKETIILFNEEEQTATVNTCNNKLKNKLQRIAEDCDAFEFIKSDEYSVTYKIPKKCISINAPRQPRELTDEQRAVLSERMRNLRSRNKEVESD